MGSCGASQIEDRQSRADEHAEGQMEGLKAKAAGLNSFRPSVSRVGAGHREKDTEELMLLNCGVGEDS